MAAHSTVAPSSADRWVNCPGSVAMAAQYPEEETEQSREGTAAHWIGSEELEGRPVTVAQAPNGVILTDEMRESAQVWVDHVREVMAKAPGGEPPFLRVELRTAIARIHEECFGTPDTWLYLPHNRHLHVWDFKHGHDPVDAVENMQLMLYVCGILDQLGDVDDQRTTVSLHIVQPRAYRGGGPVQTWTTTAAMMRAHWNHAREAAHVALSPNAHTKAGAWCRHCPARHACPTLQRAALAALTFAGGSRTEELSPDYAGAELELLRFGADLIKARITGREADVQARLRRGERVPGWNMAQSSGRAKWDDMTASQAAAFGDMCGVDIRKPMDVMTPTQAETEFKRKGVDGAVIQLYSKRPDTGLVLVSDRDTHRQALAAFGAK